MSDDLWPSLTTQSVDQTTRSSEQSAAPAALTKAPFFFGQNSNSFSQGRNRCERNRMFDQSRAIGGLQCASATRGQGFVDFVSGPFMTLAKPRYIDSRAVKELSSKN